MKLAVICFTRTGVNWCGHLVKRFRESGTECEGYVPPRFFEETAEKQPGLNPQKELLKEWTRRQFEKADGLIFIGAAGIAVRAIAPFVHDKLTDPAVVVMDEAGRYAVSLLSGHVGGANELARMVAEFCGAEPVITTATDVNKKTAIDVWASKRELVIGEREQIKQVAAAFLEDRPVGFFSDFDLQEEAPEGCVRKVAGESNIWLTIRTTPEPQDAILRELAGQGKVLRLIPRILTVGIGCRRGIAKEQIGQLAEQILAQAGLERMAVARLASIDRKKEEKGICELARAWQVPFVTFPAEELEKVQEPVEESAFVRQVTGTGNVCERAALAGAGPGGKLLVGKQAQNGVTVAVAAGIWRKTYTEQRKK